MILSSLTVVLVFAVWWYAEKRASCFLMFNQTVHMQLGENTKTQINSVNAMFMSEL